ECAHFRHLFLCFFRAPAPSVFYTLSLHDALPIFGAPIAMRAAATVRGFLAIGFGSDITLQPQADRPGENVISNCSECRVIVNWRSEEHTSELQSLRHLVCRLLLEKKKSRSSAAR